MKINLQNARVRPIGHGGFAQRTAAGFVVVGSGDSGPVLTMIDASQTDPELINQITEQLTELETEAFAMLFTAGGEIYVMLWGRAQVIVEMASSQTTMGAKPGRVLLEALSLGSDDETVRVVMTRDPAVANDVVTDSPVNLQSGTVAADAVDAVIALTASGPANIKIDLPVDDGVVADDGGDVVAIAEPSQPPAAQEIVFADDVPEPPSPTPQPSDPPTTTPAPVSAAPPAPAPAPASADPTPAAVPPPLDAPVEEILGDREATKVSEPVLVLGVSCSQGHHNHPDALYCSQCGTKMGVHQTTVFINGPRPPLGVLVVDDGTTYSLTSDLVIGREPGSHDAIEGGTALPMILSDETLSLSRKHAQIMLDEWAVFVSDLGSSNGTWLNRPAHGEEWSQITAHHAMQLEPGDRLRVGGRIIQVELHHVR